MMNVVHSYFSLFYRATLDELKMFLENEFWALCPVQANFGISSLQVCVFCVEVIRARAV